MVRIPPFPSPIEQPSIPSNVYRTRWRWKLDMRLHRLTRWAVVCVLFSPPGCGWHWHSPLHFGQSDQWVNPRPTPLPDFLPNPIQIPNHELDFVWNQIVDTVDDYFQIDVETRAVRTDEQWLEGRIRSFPEIGSTYLEPWRKDALPGFQRLQSSLQTIRRTADVRVIPNGAGYQISVEVLKDLEDVDRSLSAADGSASQRHDGSVVRTSPSLLGQPITLDWIEQERDSELEQRILREITGRLSNVTAPRRRFLHD